MRHTGTENSKVPSYASKKADIQQWLSEKGVKFTPLMVKAELLELVKQNKPPIRYRTDEIAEMNGHVV